MGYSFPAMATPVREVDVEVLPKGVQPPPPHRAGGDRQPVDPLTALVAKLMDSLFQIPGTKIKVGLDPLIGLIPGVGSGASALVSLLLIARSASQGVPTHILARMVGNVLVNAILDAIPVVGDAASIFFRSNDRNYELMQKHAGTRRAATTKDWIILGALFLSVIAVVVLVFVGMITVLGYAFRAIRGQ
jgi:hypothetical protein